MRSGCRFGLLYSLVRLWLVLTAAWCGCGAVPHVTEAEAAGGASRWVVKVRLRWRWYRARITARMTIASKRAPGAANRITVVIDVSGSLAKQFHKKTKRYVSIIFLKFSDKIVWTLQFFRKRKMLRRWKKIERFWDKNRPRLSDTLDTRETKDALCPPFRSGYDLIRTAHSPQRCQKSNHSVRQQVNCPVGQTPGSRRTTGDDVNR